MRMQSPDLLEPKDWWCLPLWPSPPPVTSPAARELSTNWSHTLCPPPTPPRMTWPLKMPCWNSLGVQAFWAPAAWTFHLESVIIPAPNHKKRGGGEREEEREGWSKRKGERGTEGGEREREDSCMSPSFFIRGLISFMRATPSWPNYLPKVSLAPPSHGDWNSNIQFLACSNNSQRSMTPNVPDNTSNPQKINFQSS